MSFIMRNDKKYLDLRNKYLVASKEFYQETEKLKELKFKNINEKVKGIEECFKNKFDKILQKINFKGYSLDKYKFHYDVGNIILSVYVSKVTTPSGILDLEKIALENPEWDGEHKFLEGVVPEYKKEVDKINCALKDMKIIPLYNSIAPKIIKDFFTETELFTFHAEYFQD